MKFKITVRLALLLSFYLTAMYCTGITFAQDKEEEVQYQVVRLLSEEIVHSMTTIQLGTVVIWVNEDTQPAKIKFTNGNGMVIGCDGSESYVADPEQIISELVPHAGVESLCLVQRGRFEYTVTRGTGAMQGTIVVK